ncbi:unnamed protein product [Heligmosomoides polygyrus]|uniref:protein-tyrosine-phosphatase n=1 Tax=Heligmosomoides polygyrus TaxID=6339 RepID=A0A183G907_HELPZ|nr:unnamed protein product [Heligmosomoides polygyrus]
MWKERLNMQKEFKIMNFSMFLFRISRFKLSHIHCTSWPDHSAPESAECVIAIHKMLLKNHIGRPIVVHCSAGIGRTCTFVGQSIQLMLERVLLRRNASPISIVRLMRRCRMGAIQASVQFVFMQLVLLELFCQVDPFCFTGSASRRVRLSRMA